MGGGFGGERFKGTAGFKAEINKLIESLPRNPDKLKKEGWKEITHPKIPRFTDGVAKHRQFVNEQTGLHAQFDRAVPGAMGFKAIDHYHVKNTDSTSDEDFYLDKDGNPVAKGSSASHIIPRR